MESNNTHLPNWLIEHLQATRQLFGVGDEWHIFPVLVQQPGDKEFGAVTDYDTAYLNAVIKFDDDIRNNDQGQQVVLHEVLHIALYELAQTFEYALKLLPTNGRDLFSAMWQDAEERTIQRITRAMQKQIRPLANTTKTDDTAVSPPMAVSDHIATNGDASA